MNIGQRLDTRRRVLKGMMRGAAISVGLPYLDCFLNGNGTALAATGQPLPVVYSSWYWLLGFNPGRWEPKGEVKISELGPEMKPLERFKDKINIYSGMQVFLDGRTAQPHFTGNVAIATGTTPRSDTVLTPTIDTLIADRIGTATRFKSLEMAATGDPKDSLSYRSGGAFQPAEPSPADMYARLFGPGFKDPSAADFTPDPQLMARQSVLSAVRDQRQDLERRLGASDRRRLDEYFTSLRQLEQQLAIQLERPAPMAACTIPKAPANGPIGSDVEVVTANHKLFAQLAAHAFACNQTRVVNLTFSVGGLRRAGNPTDYHTYTHEELTDEKLGCQPDVEYFATRVAEGLADYIGALDRFTEGDKTLLDRALIMGITDTGFAKLHTLDNIPLFTAGSAGGRMKTGFHIVGKGEPTTRVGLTVQQALGIPVSSWGTDSMATTKTISEVLA